MNQLQTVNNDLSMEQLGAVIAQSGLFPGIDKYKAVVKVMAGQELGIPAMAAMRGIHVIEGKTEISAGLMAGLVKRSGRYDYKVLALTEKRCEIKFFERHHTDDSGFWAEAGTYEFTMEEATSSGINKSKGGSVKVNWQSFPKRMLFSRCLSNGVRTYCPDLLHGNIYVEGEASEDLPEPDRAPPAETVAALPQGERKEDPPVVAEFEPDPGSANQDDTEFLTEKGKEEYLSQLGASPEQRAETGDTGEGAGAEHEGEQGALFDEDKFVESLEG